MRLKLYLELHSEAYWQPMPLVEWRCYICWISGTIYYLCCCFLYQMKLQNAFKWQPHVECSASDWRSQGHEQQWAGLPGPGPGKTATQQKGVQRSPSYGCHLLLGAGAISVGRPQDCTPHMFEPVPPHPRQEWKNPSTRRFKHKKPISLACAELSYCAPDSSVYPSNFKL